MKLKVSLFTIIKVLQIIFILPKVFALKEKRTEDELNSEHEKANPCDLGYTINNQCAYDDPIKCCVSKTALSSVIALSDSNPFHYNKIKNLIVFGDSHSSIGTNYTDMSYSGSNHSGGNNWSLYLMEFNKMKLWSFASAGAVVDSRIAFHKKDTTDLLKQYELFYERMTYGKKYFNEWTSDNTLIAIHIGTNDISHLKTKCKNKDSIFCTRSNKPINENIDDTIEVLFNLIDKLYDDGARNLLLFTISPWYYILNKNHSNKRNILRYNNSIKQRGKQFFEKHSDVNLIIYNTIDKLSDIYSNCTKYKFKDCNHMWKFVEHKKYNISDYLWADSHLSYPANKILAEDINSILNSINNLNVTEKN